MKGEMRQVNTPSVGAENYSKLLLNEPPLQVLPSLAVLIGLNEAIVLQQIHYLLLASKNEYRDRRWVFNTYEDWQTAHFPFLSLRTLRRTIKNLEKGRFLLTTALNKRKADKTKWYAIDYKRLNSLMVSGTIRASGQNGQSIYPNWPHDDVANLARPLPIERLSSKERPEGPLAASAHAQTEAKKTAKWISEACKKLETDSFDPYEYVGVHQKANIPPEVTLYILGEILEHLPENPWAYGQTILKRYWPEHNYQQELAKHYALKNAPASHNRRNP